MRDGRGVSLRPWRRPRDWNGARCCAVRECDGHEPDRLLSGRPHCGERASSWREGTPRRSRSPNRSAIRTWPPFARVFRSGRRLGAGRLRRRFGPNGIRQSISQQKTAHETRHPNLPTDRMSVIAHMTRSTPGLQTAAPCAARPCYAVPRGPLSEPIAGAQAWRRNSSSCPFPDPRERFRDHVHAVVHYR